MKRPAWLPQVTTTPWRRFALGVALGCLVWWAWPSRTPIVTIDVDRGLADCPWFITPPDPNGPPSLLPDPRNLPLDAIETNPLLVLRNRERVVYAERVAEVRCSRSTAGPRIVATLLPTPRPVSLPSDEPPATDKPDELRTKAYRIVRGLFRQFDTRLCASTPLQALDQWFASPTNTPNASPGSTSINLGRVGRASRASARIEGSTLYRVSIEIDFSHTPPPGPIRICLPRGTELKGSILPFCPEGDPSAWLPTARRRCPEEPAVPPATP